MLTKGNVFRGRFSRHQREVLHKLASVLGMDFVDVVTEVRAGGMIRFLCKHRPPYPSS